MDKKKSKYSAVPTREVICAPVYRGKGTEKRCWDGGRGKMRVVRRG